MDRFVTSRLRRSLAIGIATVVTLAVIPVAFAGPAGAVCPDLGPTDHWIGGYTYNRAPNSSFFVELDLASDGTGQVTGSITSLNGSVPNPNTLVGTLSCGQLTAAITGLVNPVINIEATLGANGNEIVGGSWSAAAPFTDNGNWSAARVVRSAHADAATELTTDPTSSGATPAEPLQVGVTSPTAGSLAVELGTSANPTLAGYQLLDQVVHITAPTATPEIPLQFQFVLDGSALLGAPAGEVQVFRNGTLVADCAPDAGSAAIPNPCVANRVTLAGGDVQVTIRTAAASIWSFGVNANRGALRVWTAALPAGRVGHAYTASLTGLGGKAPYKWKKFSKLPKGLHMKAKTGVISGKPKVAGTFTLNIQVKDATKLTANKLITLTVA